MCSNTSSGNNGGGSSGGDGSCWSSGYKKPPQKRQRVPKRGPGVAELEKILEQETRVEMDRSNVFNGFFPPPPPSLLLPPSMIMANQPFSNSQTQQVQLLQNLDHFTPPIPAVSTISSFNHSLAGKGVERITGGVPEARIGGWGVKYPENPLFPIMTLNSSSKINSDLVDESKSRSGIFPDETDLMLNFPPLQKNHFEQQPSMGSASASASARLFNQIEHPSSQRSNHNYIPLSPEEEKMVSIKRPQPFSLDDKYTSDSVIRHQLPPMLANRPESSSFINNNPFSFDPGKRISRDAKWTGHLEGYSRKWNVSNEETDRHFLGLSSLTTSPPNQVYQEMIEDYHQKSVTSGGYNKPFYNFLRIPKEKKEANLGLNIENEEDGLDLNLKL